MKFGMSNLVPFKAALHMLVNIIFVCCTSCTILCTSGCKKQDKQQNKEVVEAAEASNTVQQNKEVVEAAETSNTVQQNNEVVEAAEASDTVLQNNDELCEAAKAGNLVLLKTLINAKGNVNAKDSDGLTPLFYAALHGKVEATKLLIDANADVNAKIKDPDSDTTSVTLLMFFAEYWETELKKLEEKKEIVKLLIDAKADVNAKNSLGATALMIAAAYANTEMVKLLIAAKADVNAKMKDDKSGMTLNALDFAVMEGKDEEAAKALFEAGATTNNEDCDDYPEQIRVLVDNAKKKNIVRININELLDAFENHEATAKERYYGKYFEIKGRLDSIDEDLEYIGLKSNKLANWNKGIHCRIKNTETKNVVKTLKKGQKIVVKGKIRDKNTIDITEIIK